MKWKRSKRRPEAIPGEVIVLLADDVQRLLEWLHARGAEPVTDFTPFMRLAGSTAA